jgi:hypothetical protein
MLLSFGRDGACLSLNRPPCPCPLPFPFPFPFTGPSGLYESSLAAGGRASKLFLTAWWVILRDRLLESDRAFLPADLLRLRPREAGDFDFRFRRVFLSLCDAYEELVDALRDRLDRLCGTSRTFWKVMYRSPSGSILPAEGRLLLGGGEADREAAVEMVETEEVDIDLDPFPRSLPL